MVDLIKERFEQVTKTLNSFYEFQLKQGTTLKEVNNNNQQLYNFAWTNVSYLSIFNDLVLRLFEIRTDENNEEYLERNKDKVRVPVDKIIAKSLYIDLLEIIEKNVTVKKFPSKNYKEYFDQINLEEYGNFYFYTPKISIPRNFTVPNDDIKQVDNKAKALEIQFKIIYTIEEYINDILLFNIKKWFDRTEIDYSYKQSDEDKEYFISLRKEYINSWLNCTVSPNGWKTYSKEDLWEELDELELSEDVKRKIEKHQEALFFGELSYTISEAILNFNCNDESEKKIVLERDLMLLSNFIKGDVSEVLIKRINNIINFDNPSEVLVAYDEITKSNVFFPYDCYIYSPGKWNVYSPKFIAYFIYGYMKRLEIELIKLSTKPVPIIKESKNKDFYFKIIGGASKKNKAEELFEKLEKVKYIDIECKNDFVKAFTGRTPTNKINWIGDFGNLKSLINYSISENLIEKVNAKWLYTSKLFSLNNDDFNHKDINSTKKTKIDDKIREIVSSVL